MKKDIHICRSGKFLQGMSLSAPVVGRDTGEVWEAKRAGRWKTCDPLPSLLIIITIFFFILDLPITFLHVDKVILSKAEAGGETSRQYSAWNCLRKSAGHWAGGPVHCVSVNITLILTLPCPMASDLIFSYASGSILYPCESKSVVASN